MGVGVAIISTLFLGGCQAEEPAREDMPKDEIVVRYVLPVSRAQPADRVMSPDRIVGRVVSDPTTLLYNPGRVRNHLRWLLGGDNVDGVALYAVLTPEGPVEFTTGLDEHYLGDTFRAGDLVAFLQHRLNAQTVEKEFRIVEPDLVRVYHERMGQNATATTRRLAFSPWDRDTVAVISLLSHAGYGKAEPLFMRLTQDRSQTVRHSAVQAIGRVARSSPNAVGDLKELLSDPDLRGEAVRALAMAGEAAIPAMIAALGHSDEFVRSQVVHAAPRMVPQAGRRLLLAALRHHDGSIRQWAVSAAIDMQGRGKNISDEQIVDALASLLKDDSRETRRSAAIALQNLGSAVVQAIPALRAAAGDASPDVVRAAARALQAVEGQHNDRP